jgi:REP element-mobilizing transposase RayT
MPDHVHLAIRLSRTVTIADFVEELKTTSSKWLKSRSPHFAWQRGYGAFSTSVRDLKALIAYIDDQDKHHRGQTFQDELRALLATFGIECDERYVWD